MEQADTGLIITASLHRGKKRREGDQKIAANTFAHRGNQSRYEVRYWYLPIILKIKSYNGSDARGIYTQVCC